MVAPKLLHHLAGAIGAALKQPAEHAALLAVLQTDSCLLESEPQAAVVQTHLLLLVPEEAAGSVQVRKRDRRGGLPGRKPGGPLGIPHSNVDAACWYSVAQLAGCCDLGCSSYAQSTVQDSWQW